MKEWEKVQIHFDELVVAVSSSTGFAIASRISLGNCGRSKFAESGSCGINTRRVTTPTARPFPIPAPRFQVVLEKHFE
jgi:hypothetical protein